MSSRLLRATLWTLMTLSALGGVGYLLKDYAVATLAERKLAQVSARTGLPISFRRAQLVNPSAARLYDLKVGSEPLLEVAMIEVQLSRRGPFGGLFDLSPQPRLVYLQEPHVTLAGRDLPDALKRFKAQLKRVKANLARGEAREPSLKLVDATRFTPSRASGAALGEGGEVSASITELLRDVQARLKRLPQIEVAYGEVTGASGALNLRQVRLQLTSDELQGTWRGEAPLMGQCGLRASLEGAKVSCERDVAIPVRDDVTLIGREVSWVPQPSPTLYLNGLTAQLKGALGARLPFSHLRADLSLGLNKDERGARPVNVTLRFPGGGAVQAQGSLSRERGELKTRLANFPASAISQRASGLISADVTLSVAVSSGEARVEGAVTGRGLKVEHEALAELPVGPFELDARGRLDLTWRPEDRSRWRLNLSDASLSVGEASTTMSLEWDQLSALPRLDASFEMKRLAAQRFADSIPPNLLPHLQPLKLKGVVAFKGGLKLDMANLKSTTLTFKADLRRLKVLEHSDQIDFKALKESFITEFTMPDGEVFVREVGPKNERWVPLSDVPPLLIQAIITQEDGGFYKHKGISLFHLRGSLVRNLTEGRFARGGSTLTMQLTRNLFLNKKKNLSRKLEELCLTWYLEQQLSKDEIIELYVNVVEFGPNLFGIKEAAERYFNKSPAELRPEEIVAITRLLPGPRLYAKFFERKRLSRAYTNRLNRLLALLVKRGHLKPNSFRKITPTNLWEPYPESSDERGGTGTKNELGDVEDDAEGGAEGGAEFEEDLDTPQLNPSLWGQPSYQAP